MEHIRLVDVARSAVIWLIGIDVVAWSLRVIIGFLQRRMVAWSWRGMLQLALAGLLLVVASVSIWAIALNAPIGWMALLVVALAVVQAGAVMSDRRPAKR